MRTDASQPREPPPSVSNCLNRDNLLARMSDPLSCEAKRLWSQENRAKVGFFLKVFDDTSLARGEPGEPKKSPSTDCSSHP